VSRTRACALLGVLVGWAAVSYGNRTLGVMPPALLPTPGDVVTVFVDTLRDGSLPRHVATSLARVGVGFCIAAVAALALGLFAALCVPVRLMLEPIIELVRPIPPLAFLPMFLALRLGFALALFVIVGAEFMGADAGLGNLIMEGRTFFLPAQIVMGALVLGLLGSLVNALLLAAERRLFRWRDAAATSS
jgi:ABC-type nitrate/sulfonate/bicarbonate transport system permease component